MRTLGPAFMALFAFACSAPTTAAGAGLVGDVPWNDVVNEPPAQPVVLPAPTRTVDVITHGTLPLERSAGVVSVLTVVELVNPWDAAATLPTTEVVAYVVTPEGRAPCDASIVTDARSQTVFAPGERRLMWARSRCAVGTQPAVVEAVLRVPSLGTTVEAGRAVLTEAALCEPPMVGVARPD